MNKYLLLLVLFLIGGFIFYWADVCVKSSITGDVLKRLLIIILEIIGVVACGLISIGIYERSKKDPRIKEAIELPIEEKIVIVKKNKVEVFLEENCLSKEDREIIKKEIEKLPKEYQNIFYALMFVESKFKKHADSYIGKEYGRGLCQVSEIGLKDYNRINESNINPKELYDIPTNIKVAYWIFQRNEVYLKNKDLNKKLIAYNEGYLSAKKKISTKYSRTILEIANNLNP